MKEKKDGSGRFFSLRFKAKDQAHAGATKPRAPAADAMDDDIPFYWGTSAEAEGVASPRPLPHSGRT